MNAGSDASLEEPVVLLDDHAVPCGTAAKLSAHEQPGLAHLAFSVLLFDENGDVLMQRRSRDKHHFRMLWANTCCSHPLPDEGIRSAARRRLSQELGIIAPQDLTVPGAFWYRAVDEDSGLVEAEYDVLVTGTISRDAPISPHPAEVDTVRWMSLDELRDLASGASPHGAPWLEHIVNLLDGKTAPVSEAITL